jgi:hypothetical protein
MVGAYVKRNLAAAVDKLALDDFFGNGAFCVESVLIEHLAKRKRLKGDIHRYRLPRNKIPLTL